MNVKIDDIEIYVELAGRGDPILFIHGFPLSGALWAPLVEPLAADHQLIIPDLPGFGRSQGRARTSMSRCADDLSAVLEAVGVSAPPVVVGLSMGGYIAFEFLRRHADSVRALVLADTRAEADAPQRRRERLDLAGRVLKGGAELVARPMLEQLFAPGALTELRDQWFRIMTATPPAMVAAALHAMADRADSTPTLSDIQVPTLIIVGEHDAITPPDVSRAMHERIRDSQLEIISGAGHMTPVEAPDAFAGVLARFVARLPGRKGVGSRF